MALNERQMRFVEAYILNPNATQAAIKAGYSERTARSIGQENLTKPAIRAELARAREERAERTRTDADKVVKELAKVGFANLRDLATWDEDGVRWRASEEVIEEDAAAIKDIVYTREVRHDKNGDRIETTQLKLGLHDKKSALKMLGEHVGIFGDGTDEVDRAVENFRLGAEAMDRVYQEQKADSGE